MLLESVFSCLPCYQKVTVGAFSFSFLPVGVIYFFLFITQITLLIGCFSVDNSRTILFIPVSLSLKLSFFFYHKFAFRTDFAVLLFMCDKGPWNDSYCCGHLVL